MIKKINFNSVLPNTLYTEGRYCNKYIAIYLEEDDNLARDILYSIYLVGRGCATKKAIQEYFNISEKVARNKLGILYNLNLIEYRNSSTPSSHIVLSASGFSYIQKRIVRSISNDDANIDKSNNLYFLASYLKNKNISTFFVEKNELRETYICKLVEDSKLYCKYPVEDIMRIEERHIYLAECTGNSFVYSINVNSSKNKYNYSVVATSLAKKIITALKFTNSYISLDEVKIRFLIVVSVKDKQVIERIIEVMKADLFNQKQRLELWNYLIDRQLGISLEQVLSQDITVIYNDL